MVEAAKAVRDLKKAVPVPDEKEPAIYGFLREEWLRCFDEVLVLGLGFRSFIYMMLLLLFFCVRILGFFVFFRRRRFLQGR